MSGSLDHQRQRASQPRGDGALFVLARMKLRGAVRRQLQRLRQPKRLLFALFGLLLFAVWLVVVLLNFTDAGASAVGRGFRAPPPARAVQLGLSALLFMSLVGGFGHPGVYMPAGEAERLLSSPISRGALVRHRLYMALGRTLPGVAIFGLLFARRLEHVGVALVALVLAGIAVVTLQQLGALLAVRARRDVRIRALGYVGLTVLVAGTAYCGSNIALNVERGGRMEAFIAHPWFRALAAPGEPFARVAMAPSWESAALFAVVLVAILAALVAAVTTMPIDFREAALRTSLRIEERRQRMRYGLIGGTKKRAGSKGRLLRAPFWLGRGPAGAVVWLKSCGLLRRSPTALVFAGVMLALAFGLSLVGRSGGPDSAASGAFIIAIAGGLYLCGTLRLDLREEVDRMEAWKALPIAPRRLFTALITTQWAVVSGLVIAALLARVAIADVQRADALLIALFTPFGLAVWIALDNAFFLYWPVRVMPGPGGSLQHVGRSTLLVLLRGGACLVVAGIAAGAFYLAQWGTAPMLGSSVARLFGTAAALAILCVAIGMSIFLGGRALAAYDPAREQID